MLHSPLDRRDDLPGVALVPKPIEILGHDTELDDKVAREVFRFGLAALLPPEPEEGGFIGTHDNPSVGAADMLSTMGFPHVCIHFFLRIRKSREIKPHLKHTVRYD